jgi:hypothetical protein
VNDTVERRSERDPSSEPVQSAGNQPDRTGADWFNDLPRPPGSDEAAARVEAQLAAKKKGPGRR